MVEKSEPSDESDSGPEPTSAEITAAIVAWCAWDPTVAEHTVDHPETRAAMCRALRSMLVSRGRLPIPVRVLNHDRSDALGPLLSGSFRCDGTYRMGDDSRPRNSSLDPLLAEPKHARSVEETAAGSDACAHARARETPGDLLLATAADPRVPQVTTPEQFEALMGYPLTERERATLFEPSGPAFLVVQHPDKVERIERVRQALLAQDPILAAAFESRCADETMRPVRTTCSAVGGLTVSQFAELRDMIEERDSAAFADVVSVRHVDGVVELLDAEGVARVTMSAAAWAEFEGLKPEDGGC